MSDRAPTIIAVTGFRNSGKTTAVEGLVETLTARGFRVGTVKHCHHAFTVDRPGKDSWRHRQAGSYGTLVVGPDGYALMRDSAPVDDPVALARTLFHDADLVLVEGGHWLPLPRVEVTASDGRRRPASERGSVLSRLPWMFGPRDIRRTADRIESCLPSPVWSRACGAGDLSERPHSLESTP